MLGVDVGGGDLGVGVEVSELLAGLAGPEDDPAVDRNGDGQGSVFDFVDEDDLAAVVGPDEAALHLHLLRLPALLLALVVLLLLALALLARHLQRPQEPVVVGHQDF